MGFLESIFQDIRYALRMMRNGAGLSTVGILSLALGIGATTAIFSVMNALLLKPLPVLEPDRLVDVSRSDGPNRYTYAIWRQIQSQQNIFSGVFAYGETAFDLANEGEKQSVSGLYVSGDYFTTLGVSAILGRTLAESDDRPGVEPVCVISYDLWQRRYGQSQSVIGQNIIVDGHPVEVVGVAPRDFFGVDVGFSFEVIVPLQTERIFNTKRPALDDPQAWWLTVVGRLKPGVGISQTSARLRVLGPEIFKASVPPDEDQNYWQPLLHLTLLARPIGDGISYTRYIFGNAVLLMMVMAGVVLIIACLNLANLLLARSVRRQREIATRRALGASRSRLIQQLLTESIVLALIGAGAGLVLAHWGTKILISAISFPRDQTFLDLSWDPRLAAFAAGTTLLCALLFGLAPAVRAAHLPVYSAMKGISFRKGRHQISGSMLIVVQVSLSMALIVGAGLLVRTLQALLTTDLGYEPKGVLVVEASFEGRDDSPEQQAFLGDELLKEFRSVPGVISASRMVTLASRNMRPNVIIQTPGGGARRVHSFIFFVSPDFFKTRRTPILAGRDFNREDGKASPSVAIISEAAAQMYFPGMNPLGLKYSQLGGERNELEDSVEIVGIVKNINYQRPDEGALPVSYRPVAQCTASCTPIGRYELRFTGPLSDIRERVKASTAKVDFHLALNFRLLSDEAYEVIQRNRATALIAAFFGLLTVALAMVGIYGVTSYGASQRTHEIGVRMALGARPGNVFRMIVGEAITVVFAGVALGAVAGFGVARAIRGVLFNVTPADPLTFTLAASLILFVAMIAAYLPAYRASRTDPIMALRVD